ncbi:MAG: sporulation protein YtxC [Peptococcaceae bacterium]
MQRIFLDIPAGVLQKTPELQSWLEQGTAQSEQPRQHGYDRILLQADEWTDILDLLENITFQESMRWIWSEQKKDYQYLLGADRCEQFQAQTKGRIDKMEPQLRATIRQDLEQLLAGHNCFNIDGYLKFTANKLKLLLQRLLQDEYHRAEQELEQEEFIELLRFFISIQPSVLDYAYLTIYHDRFTLTDAWGNDLRQIYLDSLLEEEIDDVSDNDLIMSILITLLPREIYLDVQGKPPSAEFLLLLQRVFGEQIVWKQAENK